MKGADMTTFDNHPDPSTDFCMEVERLEGWVHDIKIGLRSQWPFWGRLSRLLAYNRSPEADKLDEIAQRARPIVETLEGRVWRWGGTPMTPALRTAILDALMERRQDNAKSSMREYFASCLDMILPVAEPMIREDERAAAEIRGLEMAKEIANTIQNTVFGSEFRGARRVRVAISTRIAELKAKTEPGE